VGDKKERGKSSELLLTRHLGLGETLSLTCPHCSKEIVLRQARVYREFRVEFPAGGPNSIARVARDIHPNDLRKPIEVFQRFIEAIGKQRIAGFNYTLDERPPLTSPSIRGILIRVNLVDEQDVTKAIEKVERYFRRRGVIQGEWAATLRPWIEPDFAIRAREAATMCALKLKEVLDRNPDALSDFTHDPEYFAIRLIVSVLQQSGIYVRITWTSPLPDYLDEIAKACSQVLSHSIGDQKPEPDFLEHFVSALSGCMATDFEWLLRKWNVGEPHAFSGMSRWQVLVERWRPRQQEE